MLAPGGTTTFLSRIVLRTTAPAPTVTPLSSTEPVTSAPSSTRTSGESTERLIEPPETTTPGESTASSVCAGVPCAPWTSLTGGCGP